MQDTIVSYRIMMKFNASNASTGPIFEIYSMVPMQKKTLQNHQNFAVHTRFTMQCVYKLKHKQYLSRVIYILPNYTFIHD